MIGHDGAEIHYVGPYKDKYTPQSSCTKLLMHWHWHHTLTTTAYFLSPKMLLMGKHHMKPLYKTCHYSLAFKS